MITKFIKNLINLLKEKSYLAFLLNHKVFCCKNNNKLEMSNEIENLREVLEFIGEHIEEMKAEIQELQDEEIIFIFKNNKMKVEKEDIWEIVKERIEKTYGTINQDSKKKDNTERKKNKIILLGIIFLQSGSILVLSSSNSFFSSSVSSISQFSLVMQISL